MPTSVSFAKKKPQSLEWFAEGLDIIVGILDNGITVDKLHHTFEFAYYIAGYFFYPYKTDTSIVSLSYQFLPLQ